MRTPRRKCRMRVFYWASLMAFLLFCHDRQGNGASSNTPSTKVGEQSSFATSFRCSSHVSPEAAVLRFGSELHGRLGNYMVSMQYAVQLAILKRCHLEFPRTLRVLPGFSSECYQLENSLADPVSVRACPKESGDYFFKLASQQLDGGALEYEETIRGVMRLYTGTNSTHAYGRLCPAYPYVGAHIRSGDVTLGQYNEAGEFKRGYAHSWSKSLRKRVPLPTSFYLHVISLLLGSPNLDLSQRNVHVFSEDSSNPTITFMKVLQGDVLPNLHIHTGRRLIDDVILMACSSNFIASRGTFYTAIDMRDELKVHKLLDNISTCEPSDGRRFFYKLVNASKYNNLIGAWRNTPQHRDIINERHHVVDC